MIAPKESREMETIQSRYHPIKDWRMDPAGYFLIRINDGRLEVGLCKKDNIILKKFVGTTAEEVYNTIIRHIELRQDHAAYLGKELERARIARELGVEYVQDAPLDLSEVSKDGPAVGR